ncbi:TPA: hypothetical protein DCY43_00415 [candidate division WWE3 bacterium]|uniref:ATPase n=2 Tax=Bacteria candidate phyla TaxID=1783234 RepID=A0A0G0X8F4_9BACT|nr:MAG: ATPase [Candidatus Roizmanbacteria bacterium GW2011_GWC2_41_7]HAZ29205.1 hypothetical protein [candidate division WWE3 bacterium]
MIVKRKLFSEVEKYLEDKQAIVVTGMRRVGKTTLLTYFFDKIASQNKIYLDLEDPLNRAIFDSENYEEIKAELTRRGLDFSGKAYVFLDEIQYASNIPSVVKYLYDHYSVKFLLTGSASFYLKNLFSESLAGRKVVFEMFPLDFEEFLQFKNVSYTPPAFAETVSQTTHLFFSPFVSEYLRWGGMPQVVLQTDVEKKEAILRDIFSSFFQKEVQVLGDFSKNSTVRSLILLLSRRVGQKVDLSRISQEIGVSRQTLYDYLEFLSGTYFVSLLPALGRDDVAVRKQRKLYFEDVGLFSILDEPPFGSRFENSVLLNLRGGGEMYYWQSKTQEIDFVVKGMRGEINAFEVKETATNSDIKKLSKVADKLGLKNYHLLSHNFVPDKMVKYLFQLPDFCKPAAGR